MFVTMIAFPIYLKDKTDIIPFLKEKHVVSLIDCDNVIKILVDEIEKCYFTKETGKPRYLRVDLNEQGISTHSTDYLLLDVKKVIYYVKHDNGHTELRCGFYPSFIPNEPAVKEYLESTLDFTKSGIELVSAAMDIVFKEDSEKSKTTLAIKDQLEKIKKNYRLE